MTFSKALVAAALAGIVTIGGASTLTSTAEAREWGGDRSYSRHDGDHDARRGRGGRDGDARRGDRDGDHDRGWRGHRGHRYGWRRHHRWNPWYPYWARPRWYGYY